MQKFDLAGANAAPAAARPLRRRARVAAPARGMPDRPATTGVSPIADIEATRYRRRSAS